MEQLFELIAPAAGTILAILSVPLGLLAGAVLLKLGKKFGLDIEAQHRNAFQSSITNGALEAARRLGGANAVINPDMLRAAVGAGTTQAYNGAKDAIKEFDVPLAEVERRVEAQTIDIVSRAQAAATGPAPVSFEDFLTTMKGGKRNS